MTARLYDRDRGARALIRDANRHGAFVKVGVLGPKGNAPKTGSKTGATVAQIAAYNHEGTATIPPRQFIVVWFDENLAENKRFAKQLAAERLGRRISYDQSLKMMGARAVGGIQKRMVSGPFAPNAKSTLAAKAPKNKPLINTGQTRASVAFELEKGGL